MFRQPIYLCFFFLLFCGSAFTDFIKKMELENLYYQHRAQNPELQEHYFTLWELARECSSAVEVGVGSIQASWPLLKGLADGQRPELRYIGIDEKLPEWGKLQRTRLIAESQGIDYQFWKAKECEVKLRPSDLLLLHSAHTYCHLSFQLENFSPAIGKYIAIYHTESPWKFEDNPASSEDYSEYDGLINRAKRGLWPAIVDFLNAHPEWCLYEHYLYNQGLTLLKRREPDPLFALSFLETAYALKYRMILCTGPSLQCKDQLKLITDNDLKFIPFKKIFVATNDPKNLDIAFNGVSPVCALIKEQGHQLDCINCIITTLRNAANDPDCKDDDIILFKHESTFISDMHLFTQAVKKIVEGHDAVVRISDFAMTDAFLIKVSAAREFFKNRKNLDSLGFFTNCEHYFTFTFFDHLPNLYSISINRINRHWEDNELGLFHIYSSPRKERTFWDKLNYRDLYQEDYSNASFELPMDALRAFFDQKSDFEAVAIDLGSEAGFNALSLSGNFHHVIALENDSRHRQCLLENIELFRRRNISVSDRRLCENVQCSRNVEGIPITLKQFLYDTVYANENLQFHKIALIHCNLQGAEEEIFEDLLCFAYYNNVCLSIVLRPDLWDEKTIQDVEYLLPFFKLTICYGNSNENALSLASPIWLLEPIPDAGILRKKNMPAVIIGYNLLTCIRNMVDQLEKYTSDITIIDNNSNYEPLLEYYQKEFKYTLLQMKSNRGSTIAYDPMIQALTGDIYLVTDPDLQFNPQLPQDFISTLLDISTYFQSPRVGFALCIDAPDIRDDLSLVFENVKYSVREWESQFWKDRLNYPQHPQIELYRAPLDTTFCLVNKRATDLKNHIRIAGDFTCKHIPWHEGFLKSLQEGEYAAYRKSNNSTSWKN